MKKLCESYSESIGSENNGQVFARMEGVGEGAESLFKEIIAWNFREVDEIKMNIRQANSTSYLNDKDHLLPDTLRLIWKVNDKDLKDSQEK